MPIVCVPFNNFNSFSFLILHLLPFLFRQKGGGKSNANGGRKTRHRERTGRAMPAPEANAELQANLDVSLLPCI